MKSLKTNKTTRKNFLTYALVILAYAILQAMHGSLSSSLKGMLVPICAYVVMAISLNLTVGVLGELSLGHAGFMSVGAFTGATAAIALQNMIPAAPARLAIGMAVGAAFAALAGFLIGIPVLRLKGDYLAIVTLAFGEIMALTAMGSTAASSATQPIWRRAASSSSAVPWASAVSRKSLRLPPVLC